MSHRFLLAAVLIFAGTAAQAGDWLGGQYIGQISGCGHCGGSLYTCGYGFGGKGLAPQADYSCADCDLQNAPVPAELPYFQSENSAAGVDAIPDPQVPVLRTAYTTTGPSSRRTARQANDDILPIAPDNAGGAVKTMTHVSQPERLAPPSPRWVAPNAWSDRLYR